MEIIVQDSFLLGFLFQIEDDSETVVIPIGGPSLVEMLCPCGLTMQVFLV